MFSGRVKILTKHLVYHIINVSAALFSYMSITLNIQSDGIQGILFKKK